MSVTKEDLLELRDDLRREVAAEVTGVQVTIGAMETKFSAKLSSLKAWGIAALLGGQALAGITAGVLAALGKNPAAPISHALHYLGL